MYYERRQSKRLQRFDVEFDTIFINQATWYLIAHAHLYTQNMKCWNHKHSNKVCEEIHSYNNEYKTY